VWDILGTLPLVFVGNKTDISGVDCPAAERLKEIGKKAEMPVFLSSAKTGDGVDDLFRKIGDMMISGDYVEKKILFEGGSLAQAVDEIVSDFCEQYGETAKAMDIIDREFGRAKVNIAKPTKESLLMAIEYLSDVERDIHGRDVSEVNKLRRWKMIDEAD
jgi:50S ribosomal subunit-associated GTPase HflX